MPERKQARTMDLPDYPSPPTIRDIPAHAGSWGWVGPGYVAQDRDGYLWVEGAGTPRPQPRAPQDLQALVAWTEDGIALYMPRRAYDLIRLIEGEVGEATRGCRLQRS